LGNETEQERQPVVRRVCGKWFPFQFFLPWQSKFKISKIENPFTPPLHSPPMLRNRLYYGIKRLLPFSMRLGVRRWFAVRKRERVRDVWPIMPGSEKHPPGWQGWPKGKQFALVLTHDVESQSGLAKTRQLMELEMKLGFRSSFNFIPETSYGIPRGLLEELKRNGFEVGVHDLHHDGKLYWSRQQFAKKAKRINHYVKEWGAVGFRSGFMLHNLEWLHDLDVQYDASTFDTDPFEPQPEGVGTIFPFWVPRPSSNPNPNLNSDSSKNVESRITNHELRHGYVELPYTLPQDSTLFLLFQERTADIWIRKLDWIAEHGGMALSVAHPDYMSFDRADNGMDKYSVEHYEDFLEHISQKYGNQYWSALPGEVAALWQRDFCTPAPACCHAPRQCR
jgi:hypothetical protein